VNAFNGSEIQRSYQIALLPTMTDDAKKLLGIHAKQPARGSYALFETGWRRAQLDAAYAELVAGGYMEVVANGGAVYGDIFRPLYKLTDEGFKISQTPNS
jgi:hypothetical protein